MNIISILNVKQLNSLLIVSFLLLISSCKDTNKVDCQIGDSAKTYLSQIMLILSKQFISVRILLF